MVFLEKLLPKMKKSRKVADSGASSKEVEVAVVTRWIFLELKAADDSLVISAA